MSDAKKPDELPEDVEAVAAALQGDAVRVQVWRRDGQDARRGPLEYGASVPFDTFSLEEIGERFGGGEYSARFCDEKGRVLKSASFRVSGRPKPFKDDPEPAAAGDGAPAWARELLARVERVEGARSGRDPSIELATALMTAQSNMMLPIFDLLSKQREAPSSGGLTATEVLELLERGLDLGRETAGNGDGGIFQSIGLPLLSALQQLSGAEGVPVNLPGAAPSRPALPNPPQEAPEVNNGIPTPAWVRMLAGHVGQLCQLATVAARTDVWAARIVDNVSDAQLLTLEEELQREGFMRDFLAYFPAATEHRQWFGELWRDLRNEIATLERDGDDDDDGEEPGQAKPAAP